MSQTPYERYVAFCQRLGQEPMNEERWAIMSDSRCAMMPNEALGIFLSPGCKMVGAKIQNECAAKR